MLFISQKFRHLFIHILFAQANRKLQYVQDKFFKVRIKKMKTLMCMNQHIHMDLQWPCESLISYGTRRVHSIELKNFHTTVDIKGNSTRYHQHIFIIGHLCLEATPQHEDLENWSLCFNKFLEDPMIAKLKFSSWANQ